MDGSKKRAVASFVNLMALFIVLVIVIVLSYLTHFDKSVAWFSNNFNVNANDMDGSLHFDDSIGIGSVRVYKVDEDNNSATLYDNPSEHELQDILTLNQYDSVFEEKREHTPIIIKVTLENFTGGSSETEVTVTVSLKELTGYTIISGSKAVLMPYISNFISVNCSSDPSLSDASMAATEYYSYARNLFMSPSLSSGAQTFVSYSGSGEATNIGAEKADTLTFTVEKPYGQESLDIYLFLSYDENLIAKFINDNEQGIGTVGELEGYFEWGSEILFEKDIANIGFSEVESES